ncbi:hypothetical protein ABR737_38880 [Streptomyces sp. Edi2]|uniref:hypothetical protein n=1 Tax=Streptomyces sp. Edi2 TaxID=3162528 RepID=UPI0033065382
MEDGLLVAALGQLVRGCPREAELNAALVRPAVEREFHIGQSVWNVQDVCVLVCMVAPRWGVIA